MSRNATPACSTARCTVGTMASRWARLATSGTTPPNRACSSTLDASASASSVCPRAMPKPGSSPGGSRPGTRGSSGTTHHHQGVGVAGLVVAAAHADRLEVVPGVQPLCRGIVHRDLEQCLAHAPPGRLGQQRLEQLPPDSVPLTRPADRDVLHPRLRPVHNGQTGIAGDRAVLQRDQVVGALGELVPEHRRRPLLRPEQITLDRHHLGDVPPAEASQRAHCRTCLRVAATTASGRRRYSGVSGSPGARPRTRPAAIATSATPGGESSFSSIGRPKTSLYFRAPSPPARSASTAMSAGLATSSTLVRSPSAYVAQ